MEGGRTASRQAYDASRCRGSTPRLRSTLRDVPGRRDFSERTGYSNKEAAPRSKLRGPNANTRAVTDLVHRIEQIDHVEAHRRHVFGSAAGQKRQRLVDS